MAKKYYIVGTLIDEMNLPAEGYEDPDRPDEPLMVDTSLAYRDGMCGMLPVYTNKGKAIKHAKEIGAGVHTMSAKATKWINESEGE
jgi:hypothetical protein